MRDMKYFIFLCCFLLSVGSAAQSVTDHIHIDQFGYQNDSTKVAVISDPVQGYNSNLSYTPGGTLSVVDESNGQIIYSASPVIWSGGDTHTQSGDKGWWFDFSAVTTEGDYYIIDTVNNTRSYTFHIGDDVYGDVLKVATKMFYYNRCNMEKSAPYAEANWVDGDNFENNLQDYNCRYYLDSQNPVTERDLSGGWFDAGDYNKYVTFATTAVHNLLSAYREVPDVFGDDWNIPESGNGIPDILDEVNYEFAWLQKMTNADGSVIQKMGSVDYADNASAPPSANFDPRYYGNTCSSSEIAAASMYAHAALVYRDIPLLASYADELEDLAILTFDHVLPQLQTNTLDLECDDGTIKAGDADMTEQWQRSFALMATLHLWELTGSTVYRDYIVNNINDVEFISANWLGVATNYQLEALLRYSTLPGAETSVVNELYASILPHVQGDWNNFFGQNDLDLYRSHMPDWSYSWGSSKSKAEYGILNLLLEKYNVNPSQNGSYRLKAKEIIHYFHGVNPQNRVQLSNMYDYGAERSCDEIYHTWFYDGTDWDNALTSLYGPAPGFVTGGANASYSYAPLSPPSGQPIQKSYLDFNTGWPESSWEITEPAIYYQAAYIRLLAHFVEDACDLVSVVYVDETATGLSDGSTWADAFTSIDAVLDYRCIDQVDTIKIGEGVYKKEVTDRSSSLLFPDDIVIKGGYASGGSAHDPDLYEAVLSGDVGVEGQTTDNLYQVVSVPSGQSLTIQSVTISDGYADGVGAQSQGAAIYNEGTLVLKDVIISDNHCSAAGSILYQSPTATMHLDQECDVVNTTTF